MTRVRITQRTPHQDAQLFPGEVLDVDDATAAAWIEAETAIAYPAEAEVETIPEQPKAKRAKAVTNGDR